MRTDRTTIAEPYILVRARFARLEMQITQRTGSGARVAARPQLLLGRASAN
jgi:hypothetical protein